MVNYAAITVPIMGARVVFLGGVVRCYWVYYAYAIQLRQCAMVVFVRGKV